MNYEKVVIINAAAAKTGGAETIVRTCVENIKSATHIEFILITSLQFKELPGHIKQVSFETSGIKTLLFSIFGVYRFYKKYNASKILSFTNLNCILIPSKGITYFHQLKGLEKGHKDLKLKIYDILIKRFLNANIFILQSNYTRELFLRKFRVKENQVISSWPGFTLPNTIKLPRRFQNKLKCITSNSKGILPIAFPTPHKNVKFVEQLDSFFTNNNVKIITLFSQEDSIEENNNSFLNIGKTTREELFEIYKESDFMIFPSKSETVGLPIFEFLQTGKPAFVFSAEYAVKFYHQFNKPDNFILFKDAEDFKRLFLQYKDISVIPIDFSKGEWNKILQLL